MGTTRSVRPDLRVVFSVLNLRLGGQVSNVVALRAALQERGIGAELVLPRWLDSASRAELDAYATRPVLARVLGSYDVLAQIGERAGEPGTVLHWVVPSPSFAVIAALPRFPAHRILLHYESFPTQLDVETLSAFRDDPALMALRVVLNHRSLSRLGRALRSSHLATHPELARQLRRAGFQRVFEVPNLASLDGDGEAAAPLVPRRPGEIWLGYVGHSHPVKGTRELVRAFAVASARRPELRLLLALSSDGSARRLRELARELDPSRRIAFAGVVSVPALLGELDALVLPYRSHHTTTMYPSLLLEADRARCPVIVSRIPELAPILAGASESLVAVPPRDVDALARALAAVRRRQGDWRPIVRLPSEAERVDAMIAVYESMLATGGATG